MGLTKTGIFSDLQNEIAGIAKVIGHPARVAILQELIQTKSCICGDLVDKIGLAQPTISQHLKELRQIGIIKGNIEGTSICYCINNEKWKLYKEVLVTFFDTHDAIFVENDNCC